MRPDVMDTRTSHYQDRSGSFLLYFFILLFFPFLIFLSFEKKGKEAPEYHPFSSTILINFHRFDFNDFVL